MDEPNSTSVSPGSSLNYRVIAELLPIAVCIVLVNGLVFYLFAKEKHLRKQPTNYLLFSLAVCDFMTGAINIPLFLLRVFALDSITLGLFVVVLHNMVVVLVVYHIFAITVERYFAIVLPFRHRQITKKSTVKIIVAIWTVAILIAFIPFAWWWKLSSSPDHTVDEITLKIQTGHAIFCIVCVFLLPYIFIVYSHVVMFKKIKQGTYNLATVEGDKRNSAVHGGREHNVKRCLIIFALMAFVYVVCWFPWYILTIFFNRWFSIGKEAETVLRHSSHVFLVIRYLTSIANPVLYTFFKRDFHEASKTLILRRKIQPEHSSVNSRQSSVTRYRNAVAPGSLSFMWKKQKGTACLTEGEASSGWTGQGLTILPSRGLRKSEQTKENYKQ